MPKSDGSSRRNFVKASVSAALAGALPGTLSASNGKTPNAGNTSPKKLPCVRVHRDGHFLEGDDGSPFFWLCDTAWQLIQDCTRDECSYYLQARAQQGFKVIMTVVLAENGGIKRPSALGLVPFTDADPRRPNEAYFARVVEIADEAAALGLYVALVVAWGDKLTAPWGDGPRLFRNDNLSDARDYARYLASRLKDRSNVLWILGGDRPPKIAAAQAAGQNRPAEDWTPIWRAMAAGLKEGGEGTPTIVYHPAGGQSSSTYLHQEAWLSMNGMQSGHGDGHDVPVWKMIAHDYDLAPPKPTLDLEPNYEDHPVNPWPRWDPATGYFRDHDVRKQVYRSVFAGGCGVSYGHHAVWQFASKRREVINHADRDWIDALYRPAGRQMGFLRKLMESRPYFGRIPDQGLIVSDAGEGATHLQATRDRDGSYAFVYFPTSDLRATVDVGRLSAKRLRAWWFDPRTGIATPMDPPLPGNAVEFRSPSYGPDWVLVIEDADAGFALPASSRPGG